MKEALKNPSPAAANALAAALKTNQSLLEKISRARPPLPWQNAPIAWGASRDRCGFLLDKRLGKIVTSSRWALSRGAQAILITAPKSAIPGWMNDLEGDGLEAFILQGDKRTTDYARTILARNDGPKFFITNPEQLYSPAGAKVECEVCGGSGGSIFPGEEPVVCGNCDGKGKVKRGTPIPSILCDLPWDCVIWDEATNLRNPKSQLSQIALAAFGEIPHKCILSGELVVEGEEDVFMPMMFLYGKFMGRDNFYAWRHDNFWKEGYDLLPKPGKMAEIKTVLASRCYILSRKDAGLDQIPPTFEPRYCELPPKIRRMYEHVETHFELPAVGAFPGREFKQAIAGRSYMVQLASGYPKNPETGELLAEMSSDHKLKVLKEILDGDYHNRQMIILFRHNLELAAVNAALAKWKFSSDWITGAIADPEKRREIGQRFDAGKFQILLGQMSVMTFGLDLSAADMMVRFSMSDEYEIVSQSMDRIVHPLKQRKLHYVDIVAQNTYDEDIVSAFGEKRVTARYFASKLKENFYKRTGRKLTI